MVQVIAPVRQRVDESDNCVAIAILKVRRGGYGVQETLTVLQFSSLVKGMTQIRFKDLHAVWPASWLRNPDRGR